MEYKEGQNQRAKANEYDDCHKDIRVMVNGGLGDQCGGGGRETVIRPGNHKLGVIQHDRGS